MGQKFSNEERRLSTRIDCQTPLGFKVCKEETISKLMEGYTSNISSDGMRCVISEEVPLGSTLWLKLDADALSLCEEIEHKVVIVQHGVLGKVIWAEKMNDKNYDVGLRFITREEKIGFNFFI